MLFRQASLVQRLIEHLLGQGRLQDGITSRKPPTTRSCPSARRARRAVSGNTMPNQPRAAHVLRGASLRARGRGLRPTVRGKICKRTCGHQGHSRCRTKRGGSNQDCVQLFAVEPDAPDVRGRAVAALLAHSADFSSGTSWIYSNTVGPPHLPKSWIAQTSMPSRAKPCAPVLRRVWPEILSEHVPASPADRIDAKTTILIMIRIPRNLV